VVVVAVACVVVIALSFSFPSSLSNFHVPRNEKVKLFACVVLGVRDFSYLILILVTFNGMF
jgi:hypothetical protein